MTKLCFKYLAIFINENVPNSIQIVPKWVENFAQNQINLKYIAKDFQLECRQIWSHWYLPTLEKHISMAFKSFSVPWGNP